MAVSGPGRIAPDFSMRIREREFCGAAVDGQLLAAQWSCRGQLSGAAVRAEERCTYE